MPRSLTDARMWMWEGTDRFIRTAARLDESAYLEPSRLPGWSRKHVSAHVAANAEALCNLVGWAATGKPTPMYASADARAAGIEQGSRKSAASLDEWLRLSAQLLDDALERLSERRWAATVRTAQGRTVPATEIPWMRAREVWVHVVDLGRGVTFADIGQGMLSALCDDIVVKRGGDGGPHLVLEPTDSSDRWTLAGPGAPIVVTGALAEITAYLAGRGHAATTVTGQQLPTLKAWI